MMSWWKDVLFSWWLILCHFFGFQSVNEFTLNGENISQPPFFGLPNVHENFVKPDPEAHRIKNTCQDERFLTQVGKLQSSKNRSECNTPSTRQVWCSPPNQIPWHICNDYEQPVEQNIPVPRPATVESVKKITVEISYGTVAPDGYDKENTMLINGTYPGPLIEAYWGQTIELTVINKLGVNKGEITNGTAIHPHGLRLWDNAVHDGVPGITQCPIPPGGSLTYKWDLHQYGTTWYHSHLSLQYPNGIVAPMIIHGPKSANYDIDLKTILLTDWYHENPFAIYHEHLKTPQIPDSTLINGKGKFDCSSVTEPGKCKEGSYWETTFEPGKWHLLRFVNTATASTFRVSIDNHNMTIITADFTAIRPTKPVELFDITVGQRYEVLVYANHTSENFWLRSEPLKCNSGRTKGHIKDENVAKGIIRYAGSKEEVGDPTSKSHLPEDLSYKCDDMEIDNLVPLFSRDYASVDFKKFYNASKKFEVALVSIEEDPAVAKLEIGHQMPLQNDVESLSASKGNLWRIAGVPMVVNWSSPALSILEDGSSHNKKLGPGDFPQSYAVIEARPSENGNHIIFHINGTAGPGAAKGVMHPIHIHGHDFVILAQGPGNFNETDIADVIYNPVRRDVATMPADGYLIISFPVDNPGIWLLHCHLAWHASQGLALMILERPADVGVIKAPPPGNCKRWNEYLATASPPPNDMDDSGI